ncbi:MAG: hypothetical protein HY719_01445 [Planctomycetes bacterium]|nr:hypothetical protein [Planctomycetota bacterium]
MIVVDASVARGAGRTEAPLGKQCRRTLKEICNVCHRILMTPEIKEQWNREASDFARKWKTRMQSLNKIVRVGSRALLTNPPVEIDTAAISQNDRVPIEKDKFLIQAAVRGERVIVTGDRSFQESWQRHADKFPHVPKITWFCPGRDSLERLQNLS